jgi:predicted dehydrogenase
MTGENKKLRWGIISTARIGAGQVIPAIHQSNNGVVAAVGSRDIERGREFAAKNNIPKVYGSYEALLADPDIDAVYNPLPNDLHGYWSLKAAEAGKHVLCEKPLAKDAAEAEHMVAEFKRRGLLLAEAFMYRFHPQIRKVKALLSEGSVGQIQLVQASFSFSIRNEDDIRLKADMAGGALMDVGCYCVNVIRHLTGEEPTEARALADFGARSGVDERLVGVLRFPSGVLAHLDCSLRTHMTQTVDIRGTHGRIFVERAFVPFRPDPDAPIFIRHWSSVPKVEQHQYAEYRVEPVNQYTLMAEDFADSVLNQRPPAFPIEDSINNMRVIDMLLAAARR